MLLLKSSVTAGNSNLPQYTPSADELTLYATNPTIWLEGKSKFQNKGTNTFGWRERQVGTKFINAKSVLPNQVTLGSLTPVRMGFGGSATNLVNGAVVGDASQQLMPTNGQLTVCFVVRVPIRPGAGGTETAYNTGGFMMGSHSSTDNDVWCLINQVTGIADFSIGGDASLSATGTDFADGTYKMVTYSRGASLHKVYLNGTEVNSASLVSKTLSGNALIPVIGAGRRTYDFVPFVGDVMAVFLAPGGFHETPASLTALHNYFGALRTLAAAGG